MVNNNISLYTFINISRGCQTDPPPHSGVDPVLAKKTDPELCSSNEERFLKFLSMNFLDNFKSLYFCLNTFGLRRSIDALDSDNQPGSGKIQSRSGSGPLGLTETSATKSMKK